MVEANGFPYRVGDRLLREPQEIINERKQAYRRVGFEQRIQPEATLDDVDLRLVETFLARTVYRGRSPVELLQRYGLVLPRAGAFAVTNACMLLFSKGPLVRWHPRAGLRFFRVRGKERTHGAHRNVTQLGRVESPLAEAIPEAHRLAREQIRRSETLHDLFFREMPEYPEFAWQEAIVNAFAHRDYLDQSREIEVWFYDDRMEVRNPGEPVPPVTIDLLRQGSSIHASRNPLIVRVLADAGVVRDEGEGIPRMFEEMHSSSLPAPSFSVDRLEFSVTLMNQVRLAPAAPGREIRSAADGRAQEASPMHPRRVRWEVKQEQRLALLEEHFKQRPSLTNGEYRALAGLSRETAKRELQRLVQDGFLRVEGERGTTRYMPGPRSIRCQPVGRPARTALTAQAFRMTHD